MIVQGMRFFDKKGRFMSHRILDFSTSALRLRMRLKQLVIQSDEKPQATIPLEDIAVVLVSHPQVTFSQGILEGLAEHGAVLISCNRKSLPVGMYFPLAGHHQPARRIQLQISAPQPLQKQAWKQVVQAKIAAQGELLRRCFGDDYGLGGLIPLVKSGDTANVEARAARRYWQRLFENFSFKRNPDGDDPINLRLNYGYGVLRGIIARAICATGFHPAIGLHHHNQYNSYCLADDLMEPFRPLVDQVVYGWAKQDKSRDEALSSEDKAALIEPLLGRFLLDGELRTLFDCASKLAVSLVQFLSKETTRLDFPSKLTFFEEKKPF